MPEQIEIIVAEPLPHLDRNAPPPQPREVDRFTVTVDNPRGLLVKRQAAVQTALASWCREHGGRIRSLVPRQESDASHVHFFAVVEDAKVIPRARPVARAGVHAPSANRLVKR
jgi:hypothetical protein